MTPIPRTDAAYLAFAKNLLQQCTAGASAWNIDAATIAEQQRLTDNASAAYEANSNPQTCCRATSEAKKSAFVELKRFLSMLIGSLKYNMAVPEEALAAMGLPSRTRHAHHPVPVPTETPEVIVRAGIHGELIVYVDTPSLGQPDRSVSRQQYHGFMLQWRIEGEQQWHTEVSTRLSAKLRFENEDTGKRITMQAAWVNPRMLRGPWSAEVTAIVN
jgi:hypothetical protein